MVPLKNLQNADQQAAKDPRDTPLVPRGTVADICIERERERERDTHTHTFKL